MAIMRLIICLFVEFYHLGHAQEDAFSSVPENLITKRGEAALLPCSPRSSNLRVYWKIILANSTASEELLYNGIDVKDTSRFKIEKSDLTILRASPEDAATYQCDLMRNGKMAVVTAVSHKKAELIVIDSPNDCSATFSKTTQLKENDPITVICYLTYYGNAVPETQCQWTQASEVLSLRLLPYRNGTRTYYTRTINASPGLHGQVMNCTTSFSMSQEMASEADRSKGVPLFRHNWASPKFNIVFRPANLRLSPAAESYVIGSNVTCVADANPKPLTFEWRNLISDQEVINGSRLFLDPSSFVEGTLRYRCMVTNAVGSRSKEFLIKVRSSAATNDVDKVTVVYATLLFVVLILVAVIVTLFAKNRAIRQNISKQQSKSLEPGGTTEAADLSHEYDDIEEFALQGTTIQLEAHPVDGSTLTLQQTNTCYNSLTGPRFIATPAYTPLDHDEQVATVTGTVTRPDNCVDSDNTTNPAEFNTAISANLFPPKSPHYYVNSPVHLIVTSEK